MLGERGSRQLGDYIMVPKDDTHVDANPTIAGDDSNDTLESGREHGNGLLKQSFLRRDR
jgi:hypothetical protein